MPQLSCYMSLELGLKLRNENDNADKPDCRLFLTLFFMRFQMNVNAFADNITLHMKNLTIATDRIKLFELQSNNSVDMLQADEKGFLDMNERFANFNLFPNTII